ncbi:heterokaryon incompatibility protein-domain-containing protein [Ilyonectria robusta]|uniref:heterokaryon incompatibility protein-domain-containing protein n=1 Tax=Ilyonectria robusta TaxID=1079257 RepID=UPI001E8CA7C9|nr:heterokaryon incompatibility protein-domain-containing protein [Ilyonectria robusta]KAH8654252.1 heterokaryon incompatibility protein-domain-containing protein [Ilyonectria robusta]
MSTLPSNPYFSRLTGEGQIRLLKVHPEADGSRELQCELETAHLKENPSYVAVSYTWGPPTAEAADAGVTGSPTHAIRCDGDVILITRNLHDFIRRVCRDPELNSRRFWVDSICINQQDSIERASQVSFMASIYRSADMVIAWLGEEDVYTEESFALTRTLARLCKNCRKQIMPKNMGSEAFANILGPLADDRAWNSLRQFWRRRYFKRAWIIQEVALAKKVIAKCGGHILDWDHIVQVSLFSTITPWTRFMNSGLHEPTDGKSSNHALPLYLDANSKADEARRFQCSDPRDKVAKEKPRLRPVYGDRSVVDTYVSAAIQILADTDDLLLLAHAEGQDFQKIEGLPSWVPDWSCARAAGSLPRTLRGLRLDWVVQVGESKDEALIHRKPAYFPGWISILSALPEIYHTGQPKTEVFWRTLITDTAARIPHPARHPAAEEYRFAFRDWLARVRHFLEGLNRLAASDKRNTGMARNLFTNYLGIATTSVREGDSVWILSGSRVPLILREAGPYNEYRLVGGAYVHGFMGGEALMTDVPLMHIKLV